MVKIYDITQEFFNGAVFPGDPMPRRTQLMSMADGDVCNLTEFAACVHNATHIDAPCHFVPNGRDVVDMDLAKCMGEAFVSECDGEVTPLLVRQLANKGCKRLLVKGKGTVSLAAAEAMVSAGMVLVGVESQTVGTDASLVSVHKMLLENEIVILEGLVLKEVPEGRYDLCALPLKLSQCDGSPVRAVLVAGGLK